MVEIEDLEMGETYEFTIEQSDTEYKATIKINTPVGTTDYATGEVTESTYPIENGWEGKQFQIHTDGTVDKQNDPFGPIGTVVTITE